MGLGWEMSQESEPPKAGASIQFIQRVGRCDAYAQAEAIIKPRPKSTYSLSPLNARLATICRWKNRNRMSTGAMLTTAPAI